MLLHSPIKDTQVAQLGVRTDGASYPLPPYAEQRANITIYMTMQLCLNYGRRDLLPLAWAYTRSAVETHFAFYDPDISLEAEATHLQGKAGALYAVEAAGRMLDTILDYRLPVQLPVTVHEQEQQNMAFALTRIADYGPTVAGRFNEGKHGEPMGWLASEAGIGIKPIAILNFINQRYTLAAALSMLCQEAAAEYTKGDMSKANKMLDAARMNMVRYLGGQEFLHYPEGIMEACNALGGVTNGSMLNVWDALTTHLFPRRGKVVCPEPREFETDKECRDYRWRNGKVDQRTADVRERCHLQTVAQAAKRCASFLSRMPGQGAQVETFFRFGYEKAKETWANDEWAAVSFMRQESYDAFMATGHTKSVWQMHSEGLPTWHSLFSDDPMLGATVTNLRLWGEKADPCTYAALVRLDDYPQLAALGRMYGTKAVVWGKGLLEECATITLNDSQAAPFTLPATVDNIHKALVPMMVGAYGEANGHSLCMHNPGPVPSMASVLYGIGAWPNFIEVQFHASLCPEDVVRTFDVDIKVLEDEQVGN